MKHLVVLMCLLLSAAGCTKSEAQAVLERGEVASGTIGAGEQAEYGVELAAGDFMYAEVEQLGVDLRVTVVGPDGAIRGVFDGPARGPEAVRYEATGAGRHTLRIETVDEESGGYRVVLERVEPVATDPAARLDQLLAAFAGDDTPGAIVAVVRNGQVVHHQAVGMANLTYGIPFSRDTVSNIGSVSKQFTAFAVASLAGQGLLSLDDDVRDYFPEIPDLGHVVTIRQILNHTSGYREFLNLLFMAGVRLDRGDYIGRDEVLRILERQPALQDEPGTRYNYNNTAYALAALLVEKVTDTPFEDWMNDNVFVPVGMNDTRVRSYTGEIVPGAAEGYVFAKEAPYRIGVDLGGGGGATMGPGGIYTTVDDLAKWMGNFASGAVGGKQVIAELMSPQATMPGPDTHYGLGLIIDEQRGLRRVWHNGADTAHRAELLYYPEIEAGVVAMSNNGSFDSSMAREVAAVFFADDMEPPAEPAAPASDGEETPAPDIDVAAFEPYVGQYELDDYPGVVLIVSRDEEFVYLQNPGGDPRPVTPIGPTRLSLGPDQYIEFNLDDDGVAQSLTVHGGNELVATRLETWQPDPDQLSEYTGRYFSEELDTVYTIESGDEGLVLTHRRLDDIVLTPKVTDTFNGSNAVAEVRFVRNEAGEVSGLMASNVRTLNVWFARQD